MELLRTPNDARKFIRHISVFTFSKDCIVSRKIRGLFDILQLLGIKFLEMYQVSTAIFHFSVVIMKFLWSENFISWRLQVLLFL